MAPVMVGGRFIMRLQTTIAVANIRAVGAVIYKHELSRVLDQPQWKNT